MSTDPLADPEQGLARLEELETKLYKLRNDVPGLLRKLAHVNDNVSAHALFTQCTQDAQGLHAEVQTFTKEYNECHSLLELGRAQKSKLKEESKPIPPKTGNQAPVQRQSLGYVQGMSQDKPIVLDDSAAGDINNYITMT